MFAHIVSVTLFSVLSVISLMFLWCDAVEYLHTRKSESFSKKIKKDFLMRVYCSTGFSVVFFICLLLSFY